MTTETTETTRPGESRARYMLIFRGGAVSRDDVSPSVLQAHVEKWYRWSDELARQGRRNVGTALDNRGKSVGGHERIVTDGCVHALDRPIERERTFGVPVTWQIGREHAVASAQRVDLGCPCAMA